MKNLILFLFILSLSFIGLGCINEKQVDPEDSLSEVEKVYMEMREIAWASLSDTDKETVLGNWKDAKVTKEKLSVNHEVQPNNDG